MIGYALVGTNDLEAARAFFDKVFGRLGARRLIDHGQMSYWGEGFTSSAIGVARPFDRGTASRGNGAMLALNAPDRETVDAVHALAVSLGGRDEGAPGVRDAGGVFYAAYFRDLDGNKFSLFCIGPG